MTKSNIAICLYGEIRTFRISFNDFIDLFEMLNNKYNVYLFICTTMKNKIANWKTEEEVNRLKEIYNNENVIIDDVMFYDMINVFKSKTYQLTVLDYDTFNHPNIDNLYQKLLFSKMKMLDIILKNNIPIDVYLHTRPDLIFSEESIVSISKEIDLINNTNKYACSWDFLLIIGKELFLNFIDLNIEDINYFNKCVEDFNYESNNLDKSTLHCLKSHLLYMYFLKKGEFINFINTVRILRLDSMDIFYSKLNKYIELKKTQNVII